SASQVLSGDSRVMQTITRYLETLRDTVDGDELHSVIARTLRRHSRNGPPGADYLVDLFGQLDAYARDALSLPSMRIRARLLQQHIVPYIADSKVELPVDKAPPIGAAKTSPPPSAAVLAEKPSPPVTASKSSPSAA